MFRRAHAGLSATTKLQGKSITQGVLNAVLRTRLPPRGHAVYACPDGSASVPADQLSVIGEKGPELFIPWTPGYILPNSALKAAASGGTLIAAGGATNNITIAPLITVNASGGTQARNADLAKQTSDAVNRHIRAIVSDVLIEQQRVVGILRPGLGAWTGR
jgi:hypothetical protein